MPAVVRRLFLALTIAMIATLLTPTISSAHVERPSYYPDPKQDCAVQPCAGGKIPSARALASALNTKPPGKTRVVCQKDSMTRVSEGDQQGKRSGYNIRPTDHRSLQQGAGQGTAGHQPQALQGMQVQGDPARDHGFAQQRPRCRHARPLPRADGSGQADVRQVVRRLCTLRPTAATPAPSRTTTRSSAPTMPTSSPSSGADLTPARCPHRRCRTGTAFRLWASASAATSSSKALASAPTTSSSKLAAPQQAMAAHRPSATRRTSASSSTALMASSCET